MTKCGDAIYLLAELRESKHVEGLLTMFYTLLFGTDLLCTESIRTFLRIYEITIYTSNICEVHQTTRYLIL